MYKRRKQLIVFLFSLIFIAGIIVCFGPSVISNRVKRMESQWSRQKDTIYAELSVGIMEKETVALWWNEKQNKFDLFLPSFWEEGQSVTFSMDPKKKLTLDGVQIADSGRVDHLTCGIHELEIEGDTGEKYIMEVFRSENLDTLFLSVEDDSLNALYQKPYVDQKNTYLEIVNKTGQIVTKQALEGLRVRGNTSADWVKKPYQMTLSQSADLLGMGGGVKWNLLSNYSDDTLLRNQVASSLAQGVHMPYTPDCRFVDLFINGEYQGNYQLYEKVEISPNRLDIRDLEDYTLFDSAAMLREKYSTDLDAQEVAAKDEQVLSDGLTIRGFSTEMGTDDISGGYLLEIERPSRVRNGFSYFITGGGQPVTVKRPKYADWTEVKYIGSLWQQFEHALFSEDGRDERTGKRYTDYIDQKSFVQKYLVEEIVRNYDASSTSQYFYKDADEKDGRIHAGPIWDYDMSLGNPIMHPRTNQNYISSVSPYGLFAALPMDEFGIWYRLMQHEDFETDVKQSYKAEFLPVIRELVDDRIDAYAEYIVNSAIMDAERWNRDEDSASGSRKECYLENVAQLKSFIQKREGYLTGLWVDGRETKKVYLDPGVAESYVSYVENLIGEPVEMPPDPIMEGYTFVGWLNGYTLEDYDFSQPLTQDNLYLVAKYKSDADGSILIAGQ